jgi:hypothetical protein
MVTAVNSRPYSAKSDQTYNNTTVHRDSSRDIQPTMTSETISTNPPAKYRISTHYGSGKGFLARTLPYCTY